MGDRRECRAQAGFAFANRSEAMKKAVLATDAALVLSTGGTSAALANTQSIAEIEARYDAEFKALEAEMQDWQGEAPDPSGIEATIGAELDVSWEITDFSFDIPEVIFITREFSLHLLQFKWDRTSFSMHVPEIRMETKTVGKYPCFKDWKWYSCDAKMDVPVTRMVHKQFSLDLPQTWWDRASFSMDILEFFSERVEIKMHLPQFKLKDVHGEISAYQKQGEAFGVRAQQLGEAKKSEMKTAIRTQIDTEKQKAIAEFGKSLAAIDKAISDIRAAGANPANLPAPEGVINLIAVCGEIVQKRDQAITEMDKALQQLAA
jgi:hypothetical protein